MKRTGAVGGALTRPLTALERRVLASDVRALLRWQETLSGWKVPASRVNALPFVALYSRGVLKGCMGSDEGAPRDKLARAFLNSLADLRFGGVRPADREELVAEVSYMRAPRIVDRDHLSATFEAGTHGVGLLREGSFPVFLLPTVARDGHLDAAGMLGALGRKAGTLQGSLFVFDTETVVVRRDAPRGREPASRDAAAAWLASLVLSDGSVTFAVDARTGERTRVGEMHHGRAAAVLHALTVHGGYPKLVKKAAKRLREDIGAGLRGASVAGWPEEPVRVAGTLALATRAGLPLREETRAFVKAHESAVAALPWHAAQVVAILGASAPPSLWQACLNDLDRRSWAPWTLFAALARSDASSVERVARGLVQAIRAEPPDKGGVTLSRVPEVAITALTVEALRACRPTSGASSAIRAGQAFVRRCQLTRDRLPAPYRSGSSEGAFLAAPTSSLLRGDVTGHAFLALE